MMKNAKAPAQPQTPQQRYDAARGSLLFALICTAVNVLLSAFHVDWQFFFSATFSTLLCDLGEYAEEWTGMGAFRIAALLLSLGNVGLYLLCWLGSGKHRGFITAALALFALDCICLAVASIYAYEFSASLLMNALFHIWVLWSLIQGVRAAAELKRIDRAAEAAAPADAEDRPKEPGATA